MAYFVVDNTSLVTIRCGGCGLTYGVPDYWVADKKETGDNFRCPNGCTRCYGTTESDKLRKKLAAEEMRHMRTQESRDAARRERDVMERSRNAHKGQLTKVKRRVSKGVCPCCNRYFKNLHRHMASKHPDYSPEA